MLDLKNPQHTDSVTKYYRAFSTMFHHTQLRNPLTESQALIHFIFGLRMELLGSILMLQPQTQYDAFSLANLQEANVVLRPFIPLPSKPWPLPVSLLPKPAPLMPPLWRNSGSQLGFILSSKEIEDKRVKGLCSRCNEKFTLRHHCNILLFNARCWRKYGTAID